MGPSGIGKPILKTIFGVLGKKLKKKGFNQIKCNILSLKIQKIEPGKKRNVNLAFQGKIVYFPPIPLKKYIGFSEKGKKKKNEKKITLKEIVDLLDIFHILNKYPHEISAGEAQRASLARSLITQPDLLLLDEPLSNVDQSFKEEIQVRLKKILNQLKDYNNYSYT
ncbi:MAG: hypothetical protein CM15mP13_2210 [Pseudomonadota bacterium]|nr:MAG: hypothetical protein CM15mP13_2210 [Pseudomonadota bacterium]